MPTEISGTSGVNKHQDGSVNQVDLGPNVAGNGPAFRAYQNAAQTVTSTPSKVLFQAEDFDYGAAYDAATSRFQPTVAGVYQIQWAVGGAFSGNTYVQINLYKNGVLYSEGIIAASTGLYRGIGGSDLVYLNGTTDYVEVFGALTGTSNLSTAAAAVTHFSGFLARAA